MARRSLKLVLESSRPYVFLTLINLFFFLIPLSCNFYTDNAKIENTAQKITLAVSSLDGEQNTLAITLKSETGYERDAGSSPFGVDVSKYNSLFVNCLQLTDGLLANDLEFSYNGVNLSQINYVLSSGIFSNHQGKRGILHDKYQIYLYSSNANTDYTGANNFCYVTERTAQKIMAINPELESYDDVINKTITVQYGEITHTWKIGNVIIDQEEFYSQMSFIYGDFILAYSHLPGGLGKNLSLSAYFGPNTYLNVNQLNSLLPLENATYEVYRGNLGSIDSKVLDEVDSFLNGFSYNKALDAVYYTEIGIIVISNTVLMGMFLKKHEKLKLLPLMIAPVGSLVVAYIPFWIAYKVTSNIFCLSYIGVLGLLISFACSEGTVLAFKLLKRKKAEQ